MDVQPIFCRRAAGYSLIEVLVAMLVLSIGLLGIGALFITTLNDTRSGLNRSKAVALAWDMIDRVRANRVAANAYDVSADDEGTDGGCSSTSTTPTAQSCTAEELAAHDVFEWKQLLASSELAPPEAIGTVTRDGSTNPPLYFVTITWTEGFDATGQPVTDSLQVATQL